MNPQSEATSSRAGVFMGGGAYLLWGTFPLYFAALAPSGALEVLAQRIAWSSLTCVLLVALGRSWRQLAATVRNPRAMRLLTAAAVFVAANWLMYAGAVLGGHVVEAALGYYINPLITVLLGVLVLRERLRRLQWVAIGFAGCAVLVLTVGFGRPPWIAFFLALSFALYGLMKNRVGRSVTAIHSLTIETLILLVPALIVLGALTVTGHATFGTVSPGHTALLAASGIVTSVPLLLFAGGAARIPLSVLGLLQYLTPTTQLLIGILVLGESMTALRWVGFVLIWLALAIFSVDSLRSLREGRRPPPVSADV